MLRYTVRRGRPKGHVSDDALVLKRRSNIERGLRRFFFQSNSQLASAERGGLRYCFLICNQKLKSLGYDFDKSCLHLAPGTHEQRAVQLLHTHVSLHCAVVSSPMCTDCLPARPHKDVAILSTGKAGLTPMTRGLQEPMYHARKGRKCFRFCITHGFATETHSSPANDISGTNLPSQLHRPA